LIGFDESALAVILEQAGVGDSKPLTATHDADGFGVTMGPKCFKELAGQALAGC
jgi:hypothetical protein